MKPYDRAQKIPLPRDQDSRVKYTESDKARVKLLYAKGYSQRAIARETGMSRRYISFILFPERLEHNKALYKERRKDGRYYDKEKHTKAVLALRRKKYRLYKKKGK